MYKEATAPLKVATGMQHCSTSLKQQFSFIANLNKHLAIVFLTLFCNNPLLLANPLLHLIGKIVYIHDRLVYSGRKKFARHVLNERFSAHRYKSLRERVGQRFKASP